MRLRMVTVAATAALALLATAGPAFAGTGSAAPPGPAARVVPLTLPHVDRPTSIRAASVSPHATSDCGSVRARLHDYAARGQRAVACVSTVPATADQRSAARLAPGAVPHSADFCSTIDNGDWALNRTEACSQGHNIYESIIDPETGEIVGTATLSVAQDILLQTSSGLFTENDTIVWLTATGVATAARTLTFTGSCSDNCSATVGTRTAPIALGQTVSAAFVYDDEPGTRVETTGITNTFFWTVPPGVIPEGRVSWSGPGTIRCDGQLANQNAGCVFPEFSPVLRLSLSIQGAGAANVAVGESFLPDGFGSAQPLHREADDDTVTSNRNAICNDGTFFPTTFVSNDSCDEYAFASSQESGASFGLTGLSCAEAVPFQANGQWVVQFFSYVGNERCLRGHVPLDQNQAVGSVLGTLVRTDRILDGDGYYVSIAP
ncbi:hypothetical protein [Rugosimonospora africana]|uniref:Secreted protein n=1 Tax=Rugosimonospora africana TaxID=556532 RepID=A0A8J3QVS1_9ACTN|nr:hypothetical protein [Rugosimonospora africana]GIH16703.1 hypothetical protein Raf01_48750 [Rugosimonospora africana]